MLEGAAEWLQEGFVARRKVARLPPPGRVWTVVGLYERGKYRNDVFVHYIKTATAKEAADFAVNVNAERGDKIEVLTCVAGGGVAHRILPDNDLPNLPSAIDYAALGARADESSAEDKRDVLSRFLSAGIKFRVEELAEMILHGKELTEPIFAIEVARRLAVLWEDGEFGAKACVVRVQSYEGRRFGVQIRRADGTIENLAIEPVTLGEDSILALEEVGREFLGSLWSS